MKNVNWEIINKHNPTFHDESKGCKIVDNMQPVKQGKKAISKPRFYKGKYCQTHNVDLCRCGREWGSHYHLI